VKEEEITKPKDQQRSEASKPLLLPAVKSNKRGVTSKLYKKIPSLETWSHYPKALLVQIHLLFFVDNKYLLLKINQ